MKEKLLAHKKQVLLILLVVVALYGGYQFYRQRQDAELKLYGNVDVRQVSLAFNASERIADLKAEEGDTVKKGQVLARLNTKPLELAIARTKAQVAQQTATVAKLRSGSRPQELRQAEARLREADAQYENAAANFARMSELYREECISRQQYDEAEARYKNARGARDDAYAANELAVIGPRTEDIAAAEAQLAALQAELSTQEYNLSQATLTAPSDGVVRSRLLQVGDMAAPSKSVYLIALNERKWVRAYIAEKRLGEIKEGLAARVVIDSFPDKEIKGQVGYISSVAEFTPKSVQTEELRTSLVYEVRIYVDDPENILRLGMPATVRF